MAKKSTNNFDFKRLMDASGSYRNLIYGAITVVILFVIIFLGIRTLSQNQGDINEGAVTINEENNSEQYTVAEGDTLWKISEKIYGTGFNWQQIADANNIENPNNIEKGMTLNIPKLTPTAGKVSPTTAPVVTQVMEEKASPSPSTGMEKVEPTKKPTANDKEYVVKTGDSLWKIAIAQYGDGYKWVEIAKANKLTHPDIIHAGNRLAIPR